MQGIAVTTVGIDITVRALNDLLIQVAVAQVSELATT
jgi:hypothetical protein